MSALSVLLLISFHQKWRKLEGVYSNFFFTNCLILLCKHYGSFVFRWIFKTAITSESPSFGRTCGGQEVNGPQRWGNKPTSEKIAKTRRSSSKANSRKEIESHQEQLDIPCTIGVKNMIGKYTILQTGIFNTNNNHNILSIL